MQWLNITHKKHPTKKDHSRHETVLPISAKGKFGRYWERQSPEEEVKHRAAGLRGGGLGDDMQGEGYLFCSECLSSLCPREEIRETQDTQLCPHSPKPSGTATNTPRP